MLLMFCTAAVVYRDKTRSTRSDDALLLLLPDSTSDKDVQVQVWLDAASEEGVHLQTVRDSELLDPMFEMRAAGLIVPDQVHRQANDALIGALHRYVEQGGKLMLVYDACTWDLNNRYPGGVSRLSDLAGVDYALYSQFGTDSITSGGVWGSSAAMNELAIPPGAYVSEQSNIREPAGPLRKASLKTAAKPKAEREVLTGYLYGELEYPMFRTAGEFRGRGLLYSADTLIAGERHHGAGDVLFVNLPLGYLDTRTDGLLLHSFLRYFAVHMLHLPYLAGVPGGVGGLVMNWHIDAASALRPMATLRKAGIFQYGPFSADLTAGPDVDEFHDGHGLNLESNREARQWVQYLVQQGDEIGSHGGWIHNYFGRNLSDTNQDGFAQYLQLNKTTVELASGRAVTEYSAPLGNHPAWVTRWLEKHGVVAYYFTGDAGMGPTRVYRDNGREGDRIWAFPILHFGTDACLEEMKAGDVPPDEVRDWLIDVADYAASFHVVRLLYSHPIGATGYVAAIEGWLQHAQNLADKNDFHWYTMTQIANFLNARQEVRWSVREKGTLSVVTASHPRSLAQQAWMIPKSEYLQPAVKEGVADVRDQDGYWIVAAKEGKSLKFQMQARQSADTKPQVGN
jgi:hypothetical protein